MPWNEIRESKVALTLLAFALAAVIYATVTGKVLAREVIRQVTVKNVGSVDLVIHNLGYSATAIPVAFTIAPGESKGVDLSEFTFSPNFLFDGRTIFYADSKNVVFDSSMPASERDGLFPHFLPRIDDALALP